ncbi:MAG: hypothetical protein QXK88_04770 [Desulfurococcaceae archaeon]
MSYLNYGLYSANTFALNHEGELLEIEVLHKNERAVELKIRVSAFSRLQIIGEHAIKVL